jgi:uncharacterized protein (TIGR02448 family)
MDSWKALAITLLTTASLQAVAGEIKDPWERASLRITLFPTTLTAATSMFTQDGPSAFKSAKSDALAFVGSDGAIRGAQFEQAARYYHSAYSPPHMSDAELAQAIAAAE